MIAPRLGRDVQVAAAAGLLAFVPLLPLPAWAQGEVATLETRPAPARVEVALAAALAAPWGAVGAGSEPDWGYNTDALGAEVSQAGRLGIEARLRLWRGLALGLDGGLALLSSRVQADTVWLRPGSTAGAARSFRVGVHALYRLWADGRGTPWLGLGAGYEWLSFSTSAVSFGNEVLVERVSVRGWEVARVLFGWELWLVDWLAVGPVFEASLGFFNHADGTTLRDESMHGWLSAGLRLVALPGPAWSGARAGEAP